MFTLRMIHKWTSMVPVLVIMGNYYVGHLNIKYTVKTWRTGNAVREVIQRKSP